MTKGFTNSGAYHGFLQSHRTKILITIHPIAIYCPLLLYPEQTTDSHTESSTDVFREYRKATRGCNRLKVYQTSMIERLCDTKGRLEKDSVTGVFQNFPDWLLF